MQLWKCPSLDSSITKREMDLWVRKNLQKSEGSLSKPEAPRDQDHDLASPQSWKTRGVAPGGLLEEMHSVSKDLHLPLRLPMHTQTRTLAPFPDTAVCYTQMAKDTRENLRKASYSETMPGSEKTFEKRDSFCLS